MNLCAKANAFTSRRRVVDRLDQLAILLRHAQHFPMTLIMTHKGRQRKSFYICSFAFRVRFFDVRTELIYSAVFLAQFRLHLQRP